jgi:hypothetical protein
MAPKGILKSIVLSWSKPKDSMIKGPNVVMPPLGILHVVKMISLRRD